MQWAALLQRALEIDALLCPRCGSTLRLVGAIEDPAVTRKILECMKLPARAPLLEPAAVDIPDFGQTEDDFFDPSPSRTCPLVRCRTARRGPQGPRSSASRSAAWGGEGRLSIALPLLPCDNLPKQGRIHAALI